MQAFFGPDHLAFSSKTVFCVLSSTNNKKAPYLKTIKQSQIIILIHCHCAMSKPTVDLSNFIEDVRVTIRNENATYSMTAFPADSRTKEWITARQKESIATRGVTVAPSELQWCSLGLLEFMEVDGRIWFEKPRRLQIIFHISMLTPEHLDALQLKIERKHSAKIFREQIQPVAIVDFHAWIEIKMDQVRRVFYGHVKNTGAIRPMECVFEFNSSSDMQLVLDELNSEDGANLTCQVCVGGVKFEKTTLSLPKQRLVDANVGAVAFGEHSDYALFTPSQLDEFAQMVVNVITIPEMTSSGGNLVDVKPVVMSALQPILMDVDLSLDMLAKLSPINDEQEMLMQQYRMSNHMRREEGGGGGGEHMSGEGEGGGGGGDNHHSHSLSRAPEKHIVSFAQGCKRAAASHKAAGSKELSLTPQDDSDSMGYISPRKKHGVDHHKQRHIPITLYRVQRCRLNENISLQWHRPLNPHAAVFPPIEIDTRDNVSEYNERSLRDEPRKVTNVNVVRLPESAWVSFLEPSDSGKGPIDSYTVHAQPIMEPPDEHGMVATEEYHECVACSFFNDL
jgi:hypothetical protein